MNLYVCVVLIQVVILQLDMISDKQHCCYT